MNFFMEVAKLRGQHGCYGQLIQGKFNPSNPTRSLMLRTHCQTSGVSLTSEPLQQHRENNHQALAAVLRWDSRCIPAVLTRRSPCQPISPRTLRATLRRFVKKRVLTASSIRWAGLITSSLTASLATHARSLIDEIEDMGGMTQAIINGIPRCESKRRRRESRQG